MDTQEKSLPTKGQVEKALSQKRMLELLQFKMKLNEMHREIIGESPNLVKEYSTLAQTIDQIIKLEATRKV